MEGACIEAAAAAPSRPGADAAPPHARSEDDRADFLAAGSPRAALEAACAAAACGAGVLALVLETAGSTYAGVGAMAVFDADAQAGWLSGGCLEPELARCAQRAQAAGRIEWLEIDTRDDADLLSGSALGCRGRLRLALLPLRLLPGAGAVLQAWLDGGVRLEREVAGDGSVALRTGRRGACWRLPAAAIPWPAAGGAWRLPLPRPPEALLFGAGPETATLLRLLRDTGWRTRIAERRPRWRGVGADADVMLELTPDAALQAAARPDAALVMHHDFERDREALAALAATDIAFIGLLGPPRRRDDLFRLLTPAQRAALAPRLHAPVGLDLGGRGPEAIALSIAAQLQAWRARAGAA